MIKTDKNWLDSQNRVRISNYMQLSNSKYLVFLLNVYGMKYVSAHCQI